MWCDELAANKIAKEMETRRCGMKFAAKTMAQECATDDV